MRSAIPLLLCVVLGCDGVAPAVTPRETVAPANEPAAASRDLWQPLSDAQLRDRWIALFDGKTLFGWDADNKSEWSVKDGAIVSAGGPPGLLRTTMPFRDYELRCEAWLAKGGNSGVFLRTMPQPKSPASDCLEWNLCDSHAAFPTGSLVGRAKADAAVNVEGDWHAIRLIVRGDRVTAAIDGRPVLDAASPEFSKTGGGFIGLQQNGGEVRFRNVFLLPLAATRDAASEENTALFNGVDLDGWNVVPGSKATFTVEDGDIRVRGGAGFLETAETYGDFVLQFEAKANAADSNSGLFFRAEDGTAKAPSNGYELQLQNTTAGGDRTQPADYGSGFGTGAIFRRQKARYVNASDGQWYSVTLVAVGNRFASWVNGLQVTDFTDDRSPNANPREGRRDAAGRLSLQGHDPTTDTSFRNLRIVRLAP